MYLYLVCECVRASISATEIALFDDVDFDFGIRIPYSV